ncbi:MAG TPA: prolipoprotein diacylglyceryl transferase [Candidatus Borkfalkia excrementavium]|uniref:Phosphatidylglycerol--prolipoprotein diacylglyceryl transferase n=1 Tax=Candidatus Borkfalkia excrementavium TaxID=2838505 RepID=A0A9D1ZBY5_9FIRM|nr:prolipoprotein diacylglyceryl transferase [Candidatus Borkfalkia excrementavium]
MNFSLLNPGITIGGFTIYYYAIIIVSGIIIASILGGIMFKHRNIPADWLLDFLICILPLGIIGARVYYCAFDPDMKTLADWFSFESIRQGGLAIYGGIIGGAIGVVIFCLIHKINFLRVADCAIPSVVLAQGIGRWGNFANQEAYGNLVTNPDLQWFPYAVYIDEQGAWYQATFFYESMSCILIFLILYTFAWKFKKKPHGLVFCGYLILYGIERSIVEGLRSDSLWTGNLRVSQVLSIVLIICGVALALIVMYLNRKKHGSLIGAKIGEPLAILPKYYTKDQLKKMEEARLAKIRAAGAKEASEGVQKPPEEKDKKEE